VRKRDCRGWPADRSMMVPETLRLLLVTETEAHALRLGSDLDSLPPGSYQLDRAAFAAQAIELLRSKRFDVLLADQPAGQYAALELIREARAAGFSMPMLVVGDVTDTCLTALATDAGADSVLHWQQLHPVSLDRRLREVVASRVAVAKLESEQVRLAELITGVQIALSRRSSLSTALDRCASALARHCSADLAQVWVVNEQFTLELKADAGDMAWRRACSGEKPLVTVEAALLVQGKPLRIDDLATDGMASDPARALELGIRGVAIHPLLERDRLAGIILLAGASAFPPQVLRDLSCVAPSLAARLSSPQEEPPRGGRTALGISVEEHARNVIFQVDAFAIWTFLNPAWTSMTGFFVNTTVGTPFIEYIHREDREKCNHVLLSLLNGRLDYFRFELRILTVQGKNRWVEMFLQPAVGSDGAITGVSGNFVDVTERHEAERERRLSEVSTEINPNPVVELDADGVITYSNEAATRLAARLGCASLEELLPRDHATMAQRCIETGVGRLRQDVHIQGQVIVWSMFSVPGYPVVHCHGENVTEGESSESQSRQVQKIESLAQFTANAAHDFNNLLTVIMGHAQGLLNIVCDEVPLAYPLKAITETARRAAVLTRQMALFSRRRDVHPRALDLNALVNALAPMLERILGQDVALQLELEPKVPVVEGDAGLIEQMLMNLAVNAREAMPRYGALLVQTRFLRVTPEKARGHPEAHAGDFICLTVRDSGPGMDAETKEQLFDPFFSKADSGKIAGLGLANVYGIVQQHHGWIEVETEVGAGTVFHIYLPQARLAPGAAPGATAPAESIQGRGESILLVDDESTLCELLQEMLRGLGYQVQTAGSATDALRRWEEANGQFDLVIADVLMPEGMNGRELAGHLIRRKPGLRVILSSGSTPEELGLLHGESRFEFLPKPFVPEVLGRLVRKCLDETRALVPVQVG